MQRDFNIVFKGLSNQFMCGDLRYEYVTDRAPNSSAVIIENGSIKVDPSSPDSVGTYNLKL